MSWINRNSFLLLLLAAALAVPATAGELTVELMTPAPGDLVPVEAVEAVPVVKAAPVPREAVSVSRALAADTKLQAPESFLARSRDYWVDVTGAELGAGIPLYNLNGGALVRLNPFPGAAEATAVTPSQIEILDAAGKAVNGAVELMVTEDQLAEAGAAFPAGTTAFRLSAKTEGPLRLRASGLAADAQYVLHVFDAASDVDLSLRTLRPSYLHGQTLQVEAVLAQGAMQKIEGFVTSPAGRAWPLRLRRGADRTFVGSLTIDALEAPAPGLWEVHVQATGRLNGRTVLRSARTAFAAAVPTATLQGARIGRAKEGLAVGVALNVVTAGRFEVSGVLYGTNEEGVLVPAGLAQSAVWLEPGNGRIELTYGNEALNGVGAPYEVRDLRLADQGRMAVLHRQARGLSIR